MATDTHSELETFWTEHIQFWQSSHLTQRAYCQEYGLQAHQFGYWKRKLIDSRDSLPEIKGFVQLNPVEVTTSALTIQLPNQLRIEGVASDNLYLVKQLTELLQ